MAQYDFSHSPAAAWLKRRARRQGPIALAIAFGILVVSVLPSSHAATYTASGELEKATLSGNASTYSQADASAGAAVNFGGTISNAVPTIARTTLVSGLTKPWDVKFLPSGEMFYDEKLNSQIHIVKDGVNKLLYTFNDVRAPGPANEGGLLGMTVDPEFASNKAIYVCYTAASDERVVRLTLNADNTAVTSKTNVITGIVTNNVSGPTDTRHSGCRIVFGPDDYLYVTTGDGALDGVLAQNMNSLGGKVLRITRDGAAAPGNMTGGDARIFSSGHRNPQGIAFFPSPRGNVVGVEAEHGGDQDDELNPLSTGNFGYSPGSNPYNDKGVPLTNLSKYPDAVRAIWTGPIPTIEPSGICVISGPKWGAYNGAVGMAMEKGKHLRIMQLNATATTVTQQTALFQDTYGRVRTCTQGPDGNLYMTTDNGNATDVIVRLTPSL